MISRLIAVSALILVTNNASAVDAMDYAKAVKSHVRQDGICSNFTAMIDNIAFGGAPDQMKVLQIDMIIDEADRNGCINYPDY